MISLLHRWIENNVELVDQYWFSYHSSTVKILHTSLFLMSTQYFNTKVFIIEKKLNFYETCKSDFFKFKFYINSMLHLFYLGDWRSQSSRIYQVFLSWSTLRIGHFSVRVHWTKSRSCSKPKSFSSTHWALSHHIYCPRHLSEPEKPFTTPFWVLCFSE